MFFSLDLDVVAKIFPVESGCTCSQPRRLTVPGFLCGNRSLGLLRLKIKTLLPFNRRGHPPLAKHKDFSFTCWGFSKLCRDDVCQKKKGDQKSAEDSNVSNIWLDIISISHKTINAWITSTCGNYSYRMRGRCICRRPPSRIPVVPQRQRRLATPEGENHSQGQKAPSRSMEIAGCEIRLPSEPQMHMRGGLI